MYGDGVLYVPVVDFSTWVLKDPETCFHRTRKVKSERIEKKYFCFIRFIKDRSYFPGDKSTKI